MNVYKIIGVDNNVNKIKDIKYAYILKINLLSKDNITCYDNLMHEIIKLNNAFLELLNPFKKYLIDCELNNKIINISEIKQSYKVIYEKDNDLSSEEYINYFKIFDYIKNKVLNLFNKNDLINNVIIEEQFNEIYNMLSTSYKIMYGDISQIKKYRF